MNVWWKLQQVGYGIEWDFGRRCRRLLAERESGKHCQCKGWESFHDSLLGVLRVRYQLRLAPATALTSGPTNTPAATSPPTGSPKEWRSPLPDRGPLVTPKTPGGLRAAESSTRRSVSPVQRRAPWRSGMWSRALKVSQLIYHG